MPEIKAIILDYDGVIVDSIKPFMDVFNSLAKKYGYSQTNNRDDFIRIFDKNIFDPALSLGMTKLKAPMYLNDLKKQFKEANKKTKTYPGLGQLATVLSEHFKLAIVSYNFKENINEILTREKIKDRFSLVISGEEVISKSKMIKNCLEKLGLRQNEVVYITDTFADVMHGKEAHVTTIAVTWGYQLRPKLLTASPDFIVDKPSELMEALNVIIQE